MKKSSLLISFLSLCVVLLSCQTSTSKNQESLPATLQTVAKPDSAAEKKVRMQPDSTKKSASHSKKQTSNASSTSTKTQPVKKTSERKRIEHGSANQAQLDSIKKAKAKLKK